jgi:Domain of unknown function (DUF4173)
MRGIIPLLPLPLIGSAIFLGLFASANPLIGDALSGIDPGALDVIRLVFWAIILTAVWSVLRPRRVLLKDSDFAFELGHVPGFSAGSIFLSLVLFNALFALQNALDIAFLWSGAKLPTGMTLAEYAHRGAYPLIATALLAGLFVLIALRPQSETARMPAVRGLVILWVAQNIFLVGSTILRTLDYVDAYSLTILRSAALIWMGLVAIGLMLILWRMLAGKSASWLINMNAAAAGLALAGCSLADLGQVAADWNVRHARDVGGKGARLDMCYLATLGPSALVPVVELETRGPLPAAIADDVARTRVELLRHTLDMQSGGDWTWRNANRLNAVAAMIKGKQLRPVSGAWTMSMKCAAAAQPAPVETRTDSEAVADPDSEALTDGDAR